MSRPLITKEVGVSEYFSSQFAVYVELEQNDIPDKVKYLVGNPEILGG